MGIAVDCKSISIMAGSVCYSSGHPLVRFKPMSDWQTDGFHVPKLDLRRLRIAAEGG